MIYSSEVSLVLSAPVPCSFLVFSPPPFFSSPRVVNLKEISWDLYSVRKHTINNNDMSLGSGRKTIKQIKGPKVSRESHLVRQPGKAPGRGGYT